MTTYKTGNQLGSPHPKDLYDNAENLDSAVNDLVALTWVDRLGNIRKTWLGVEQSAPIAVNAAYQAEQAAAAAEMAAELALQSTSVIYRKRYVDLPSLSEADEGTVGVVWGDSDPSLNGYYVWDGFSWQWSGVQLTGKDDIEFLYDFRSGADSEPNYVVVDADFNILIPLAGGDIEFLYDFFSSADNELGFVVVDDGFNILLSESGSLTDLSEMAVSPIEPKPLKTTADAYFDFNVLTRQNDLRADIYNSSAHTLASSHTAVYAFYDALATAYPDRFAMEVLGADALGNEIRQYSYTPKLLNSVANADTQWPSARRRPPKIVITTGVHGDERDAIVDVMAVMREVLEEPYFNEHIMVLSQARIVIVPCVNPSGIDARNRYNHNNVDINRNAPSGWSSSATNAGAAPLDQLETQIACGLPGLHSDADLFVDRHNFALTLNVSAWFGVIDEALFPEIKKIALHMHTFLHRDYRWLQGLPVRLGKNANGTIARDWHIGHSKAACLVETVRETSGVDPFVSRHYSLYVTRKTLADLVSFYL